MEGRIRFNRIEAASSAEMSWDVFSARIGSEYRTGSEDVPFFMWLNAGPYRELTSPHWFSVAVFGILGTLPWLPWSPRFTLRTLLIATTLVAVVLGAIVYATRQ